MKDGSCMSSLFLNLEHQGRKVAGVKKVDVMKKRRGGKGKHKKDVEYPYGLPPDPHERTF